MREMHASCTAINARDDGCTVVRDRRSHDRNARDTLAQTLRERSVHSAVTSATFYDFCLAFARRARNKLLPRAPTFLHGA
jgi:hypothetical protein